MYERIFRFFADKRMDVAGYEEVTRSFQDVFTPVPLLEGKVIILSRIDRYGFRKKANPVKSKFIQKILIFNSL